MVNHHLSSPPFGRICSKHRTYAKSKLVLDDVLEIVHVSKSVSKKHVRLAFFRYLLGIL